MSGQRPSYEQRDRYLDELAAAYAQGRVNDSQFASRSDKILTGDSLTDLEQALAGVRLDPRAYPNYAGGAVLQPYRAPQPYRPPQPVAPQPHRSGSTRRQLFLAGGTVAFVAAVGIGLAVAVVGSQGPTPYGYASPAVVEPPTPSNYLRDEFYGLLSPYTSGAMSSVLITKDTVVMWVKPAGQTWQRVTLASGSQAGPSIVSAEAGPNIFDSLEANVSVVSEVVSLSEQKLGDTVKSAEFARSAPNEPVQIIVTGEGGGQVIWDALSRQIKQVKPRP